MTKEELIAKLQEEGVEIGGNPDRMITKFVSLGLIEKPIRYGLGKGKGTKSEFSDKALKDVKEITKLHEQGKTYEKIKFERMGYNEWDRFVTELKDSAKSREAFDQAVKAIPHTPNRKKGLLKLKADVAEHLTEVCVDELDGMFSDFNADTGSTRQDLYDAFMFCLDNVFYDLGLEDEDFEGYLEGTKDFSPLTSTQRSVRSLLREAMYTNDGAEKGDTADGASD